MMISSSLVSPLTGSSTGELPIFRAGGTSLCSSVGGTTTSEGPRVREASRVCVLLSEEGGARSLTSLGGGSGGMSLIGGFMVG